MHNSIIFVVAFFFFLRIMDWSLWIRVAFWLIHIWNLGHQKVLHMYQKYYTCTVYITVLVLVLMLGCGYRNSI